MSSADRDLCSDLVESALGDFRGCWLWSRKGLRDIGLCRGVGSSKGELLGDAKAASRLAGDAARLRKGLLEDRLTDSPGEGSCPVQENTRVSFGSDSYTCKPTKQDETRQSPPHVTTERPSQVDQETMRAPSWRRRSIGVLTSGTAHGTTAMTTNAPFP